MDKKGQLGLSTMNPTFNIFTFIVVSFLVVCFFAGLMYAMNLITGVMHNVGVQNDAQTNSNTPGYVNMTLAADNTFGKVNASMDGLRLVSMAIIFSMIMGTLLVNFLMRVHPAFFILYILMVVLAVIFSVPVSNAYETVLHSGGPLTNYLQMHSMANYILLNLPFFTAAIGVLGAIFLVINIVRSEVEGGL